MSDEPFDVFPADEPRIRLKLHRYTAAGVGGAGTPVLLIHGASANHGTFTVVENGLAPWLSKRGFDPWLLDWRGSSTVTDALDTHERVSLGERFTFNAAAEFDVPGAIEVMRSKGGIRGKIAVMGHCMGAGILAESIALGHLKKAGIDRVVLSALGLFYETSIDSRLKSEDRILERLAGASDPEAALIDPRVDDKLTSKFPRELETVYANWPGHPFHEPKLEPPPNTPVNEMCNRLRFMYGMPYLHGRLKREIHEMTPPKLVKQFGGIPLHMYIHAARNIRRGHASFYNPGGDNDVFVSDTARGYFETLEKVTLITGELNRLWHRNSIDLMYEWLCRGGPAFAKRVEKKVFADYGHQDLLWGDEADTCVFPTIKGGLRADGDAPESDQATDYDRGTASNASAQ